MKTLQPTKRWTKSPLPQLAWCTGGDTIYPNPSRGTVGAQTLAVCLLGLRTFMRTYMHICWRNVWDEHTCIHVLGWTHTRKDFRVMTHACLSTSSNSGASTMPCQLLLMTLQLVTTSHDQYSSPIGRTSVSDTEVSSEVQSHDVAGSRKTKIVSR